MALTGFEGFSLVNLPSDGVWRLTDWYEPLDPPPPPPPVSETDVDNDESRRWDAPNGEFRTLYCATRAEGAFGEKLAQFALGANVALEIEEFLEEEADEAFAGDNLPAGLNKEQIEQLNWKLAWAPADQEAKVIDVSTRRTQLALLPGIAGLLRAFGFPGLDSAALRTSKRAFTRQVAGHLHQAAKDVSGELRALGIRYESRLPPAWECWALWQPLPLEVDLAQIDEVTIDHPALQEAAALLGVPLLG
jgi:hypothetical protein